MSDSHEFKYADFLAAMEVEGECAGFCKLPQFYLFSDINKGVPNMLCKDVAVNYVQENSTNYMLFCLLVMTVGLLGVALSGGVCYYKKNKLKNSWEKY